MAANMLAQTAELIVAPAKTGAWNIFAISAIVVAALAILAYVYRKDLWDRLYASKYVQGVVAVFIVVFLLGGLPLFAGKLTGAYETFVALMLAVFTGYIIGYAAGLLLNIGSELMNIVNSLMKKK